MSGFLGILSAGRAAVTVSVGVGDFGVGSAFGYNRAGTGTITPANAKFYGKEIMSLGSNVARDFTFNLPASGVRGLFDRIEVQDTAGNTDVYLQVDATFVASSGTIDGVLTDSWSWGTGSSPSWTASSLARSVVIK